MACPTALSVRHIIGINCVTAGNGSFHEDSVCYVAGQSTVVYNRKTRRQKYVHTEITEAITAYTSGPGKTIAAVAERGERPVAHIVDIVSHKRKKSLIAPENVISKDFICLQFSADDTLLLTLSGAPDWTLLCWDWAKAKVTANITIGTPLHSCYFNPVDVAMISTVGRECVKFFRLAEKDIRPLDDSSFTGINFVSGCWLRAPEDTFIAGSDTGLLYIFQNGEFNNILKASPGEEHPITSLIAVLGGFIAGSKNGTVIFYQFMEILDKGLNEQFAPKITLTHELCTGFIIHMFLDASEQFLGIGTSDGQLLCLDIETPSKISADKLSYMVTQFHGPKPITGMDICVCKPLILTCSKDGTLKLWNFQNHELEFQKYFTEEMFSVALHPSGLHCAVGFVDKLRFYHVLVDDVRLCLEVPIKGCRECKFNKSGSFLAATNGNSILIYDFHTGEKIADLRGHNSKVRSLNWLDTGCYLMSCGQDGAVYLWDVEGSKRIAEYLQKGTTYTSVIASQESLFVVGSDKNLRQLTIPDLNPIKNQESNVMLVNIALSTVKGALFAGTGEYGRTGNIRCYSYPLNGEFDEYACTASQVSRIRLTPDENFLIVADDLGCIVIFELKNRQDRFQRNNSSIAVRELLTLDTWTDVVLVTRLELEDKMNTIAELKVKVDELKLHNEYQLKLKDMAYADKMKETNEKFVQELEQRKTAYDLLKEDRNDLEMEYVEKIKQTEEEHQYKIQEIETNFQSQIMERVDNYQQLIRERDALIDRLGEQRKQLVASHERYVDELVRDYKRKVDEEQLVRLQLDEQKADTMKEVEEIQTQFEDDIDTEIENLRRTYDDKLTASRETTLKLKGENGIMKKKRVVFQREIEDLRDEIKSLNDKDKEYHAQIEVLDKEIKSHKKDIKVRDISITEKEKKIYELKKKNQELDKFKFVLDYKIRELKLQIEPRQIEIVKMKEKINEMDHELEKYHNSNSQLDSFIGTLRQRIENLQSEIMAKRGAAVLHENTFNHFRNDLKLAMVHVQTPTLLKVEAEKIIAKHGTHTGFVKPRLEPEVEQEYHRHKEFLQKSIQKLKKDMETSLTSRVEVNSQLMQQNLELIDDINKQRELNRETKNRVQAETGRLRRQVQGLSDMKDQRANAQDGGDGTRTAATDSLTNDDMNRSYSQGKYGPNDMLDPTNILEYNERRIAALMEAIAQLQKTRLIQGVAESQSNPEGSLSPRGEDVVLPFLTAKNFPLSTFDPTNIEASISDSTVEGVTLPRISSAQPAAI